MDKPFSLIALLRNNEKKHKGKPAQFGSVAGGVEKRLQINLKNRKSSRSSVFDSIRNLPSAETPLPAISEAKLKEQYRRQQLEKWKLEKEEKKKQEASKKKKPFVAGVVRAPLKLELPPPAKPSTSGRVTRSQTRNTMAKPKSPKKAKAQSFAPTNATFKAPQIKNLDKLPTLVPPSKSKNNKKTTITFEPIAPSTAKQTRSKTQRQASSAFRNTQKPPQTRSTRGKTYAESNNFKAGRSTYNVQTSSDSDIGTSKSIKRVKIPGPNKTSKPFNNTPKSLVLKSTTDTTDSSSKDDSSNEKVKRKPKYSVVSVRSSSDSEKTSSENSSEKEPTKIEKKGRKSLPRNFSPALSGSGNTSSDVEFISETVLSATKRNLRKSLPSTPLLQVPKSESNSEQKLRSPKSPIELVLTPEQIETAKKISPCVTLSRGKDKARKEMKWKIEEGLLDEDASDIESVDYFRKQLASEMARITEMCKTWDQISEKTVLPQTVQEAVLAAVGQARLLMSQKLSQFASLVERCARPQPGSPLVTPADLHGFWEMVYLQVENIDLRFKKLEELRSHNWAEKKPKLEAKAKKFAAKPVAAAKIKAAPSSSLREMIAAKRKAIKQNEQLLAPCEDKTFEGGFFRVQSPVRSPRQANVTGQSQATPNNKGNLLKTVLSSEAKKSASKMCTPFAMLRASLLAKNIDCDGVMPLQQTPQVDLINFDATPGRSILKSANAKSQKKSIKVLFNDSNYEQSDSNTNSDLSKTSFEDVEGIENIDSAISSLEDKENSGRKSKRLVRQDAVDTNLGMMTRSQRKSLAVEEAKRSDSKKKADAESTTHTPRTPWQSRKSEATPKRRRSAKKALVEIEQNEQNVVKTPQRITRRSKIQDLLT